MTALVAMAQDHMPRQLNTYTDEEPPTGFNKGNLFLGSGLLLNFGGNIFNIGLNPEIGYSVNRWLDLGVVTNFSYSSMTADPSGYYNPNTSSQEFIYGGGVFGRAYFLPFLFVTVQPEYNWTSITQKDETYGGTYKLNASAASALVGVGYASRVIGRNNFYIALMFDALRSINSPYNDIYGHALPVLRVGMDFYLHPPK
jgi:hypothetical protein